VFWSIAEGETAVAYDILVGIPSFNEARTIGHVLTQVDAGLREHYPDLRAIVVNFDNNSTDGTRETFSGVLTVSETGYQPTEPGVSGKGANVRNFLAMAVELDVRAGAIFDADLESVTPRWIRNVLGPILEDSYDFTYPLYRRHRHDGSVTNLVCHPLVHGLFGVSVRQPIGGDFGFSRGLLRHLSGCALPDAACHFGIDIFVTTESIASAARTCGVGLGAKIHKRRDPVTSARMCQEVTDTLLHQVRRHRELLRRRRLVLAPATLLDRVANGTAPAVPLDRAGMLGLFVEGVDRAGPLYRAALPAPLAAAIAEMAGRGRPRIDTDMWCDVLYSLVRHHLAGGEPAGSVAQAVMPVFYGRLLSYLEETHALDDHEVERYLMRQADTFHDRRLDALDD
jgi:glucosylglycerate synthase